MASTASTESTATKTLFVRANRANSEHRSGFSAKGDLMQHFVNSIVAERYVVKFYRSLNVSQRDRAPGILIFRTFA